MEVEFPKIDSNANYENFLKQSDMFFLYPSKCHLLISSMHHLLKSAKDSDHSNSNTFEETIQLQFNILVSLVTRMIQNNEDLRELFRGSKLSFILNSNWWFHDLEFLVEIE